jgi:hypothetical protein
VNSQQLFEYSSYPAKDTSPKRAPHGASRMGPSVRPPTVPPRATGLIAPCTQLHKNASTTPLFSHSCKRARNPLKTRNFKSLTFHTHAHSFAVSPLFATHTQNIPGVYVRPAKFPAQLVNSNLVFSSTSAIFRDAKTQSVQLLCFQSTLRSFSLFSCKSFVCLTYAKQHGGVYPRVSDSGQFGLLVTSQESFATLFSLPPCFLASLSLSPRGPRLTRPSQSASCEVL